MIRVLVCDDHLIVRQGIKQILADAPDIVSQLMRPSTIAGLALYGSAAFLYIVVPEGRVVFVVQRKPTRSNTRPMGRQMAAPSNVAHRLMLA